MDYEKYIHDTLEKFKRYFDIIENYKINNYIFDYAAIYNQRSERYFASKKIVLDAVENNEYCFFTYLSDFDLDCFNQLSELLQNTLFDIVNPTAEHMSTFITCIIISDSVHDEKIISKIKKYRYTKSFLLSLKGWAKIRFILVDLSHKKIYSSKEGDKVKKIYDFSFNPI